VPGVDVAGDGHRLDVLEMFFGGHRVARALEGAGEIRRDRPNDGDEQCDLDCSDHMSLRVRQRFHFFDPAFFFARRGAAFFFAALAFFFFGAAAFFLGAAFFFGADFFCAAVFVVGFAGAAAATECTANMAPS
jgi:hypothetical protein